MKLERIQQLTQALVTLDAIQKKYQERILTPAIKTTGQVLGAVGVTEIISGSIAIKLKLLAVSTVMGAGLGGYALLLALGSCHIFRQYSGERLEQQRRINQPWTKDLESQDRVFLAHIYNYVYYELTANNFEMQAFSDQLTLDSAIDTLKMAKNSYVELKEDNLTYNHNPFPATTFDSKLHCFCWPKRSDTQDSELHEDYKSTSSLTQHTQ